MPLYPPIRETSIKKTMVIDTHTTPQATKTRLQKRHSIIRALKAFQFTHNKNT